ncbi:MAG: hypothetical protein ACO3A2_00105 [Bdellovibrionia bacterium]
MILVGWLSWMAPCALATDFHSPRTDALGGAGHAAPQLSDAIYMNPSYGSFNQVHSLSINYLSFAGGVIPTPQGPTDLYGHQLNVSVLDATTEQIFQAGVGFTRKQEAHFLHIGASKALAQKYGVGLGGKFIFPNDDSGRRLADSTLSFSGIFTSWIQSALIIDNLFETATEFGLYREFILGTKINVMDIVNLYLDPHWIPALAPQTFGYQAGIEFPMLSDFFLRGGTFKNSTIPFQTQKGDGFGVGLGWIAPKLALDYSFSRITAPIASFSHNLGATIYF